jgi:hypothetical protein
MCTTAEADSRDHVLADIVFIDVNDRPIGFLDRHFDGRHARPACGLDDFWIQKSINVIREKRPFNCKPLDFTAHWLRTIVETQTK